MEQNVTARSFIVRLYRVDTEDTRKITGLAEARDGSGSHELLTNLEDLETILNRRTGRPLSKVTSGPEGI